MQRKTPLRAKNGLKRTGFKAKPKKTSGKRTSGNTARSKKQARKKKLCEDYNLPIIPCSRWGTGKAPTRLELLRGMAWTVFSKFIRQRDVGKPCITCGKSCHFGDIQAGHYVPVGNSSVLLHFREDNVHGEHPACNADFHGWHLVPMRKNMVRLYGEEHVVELDALAGQKSSFKPDEQFFVDIIKKYLD